MNPVYYVSNEKPKSHNKNGSNQSYKDKHTNRFTSRYSHLYSGLPTSEGNLQSNLIYIHHDVSKANLPDVDNLSKPIIDAFTGVIYSDDSQIVKRSVAAIELADFEFVTVDMSNLPEEIATDFDGFITAQENHIVFLEVNSIALKDIKIGEI